MKLYFIPLSSYSQKALIALYEKNIEFTSVFVDMSPEAKAKYLEINPMGKIPTFETDDGEQIFEATIIIQYLEDTFPGSGTRLIPEDKTLARKARMLDRFFDIYVNDPMQKVFFDGMKPEADRDPRGVAAAKSMLDKSYAYLDKVISEGKWAIGDDFTLADCAAAPALNYAKSVAPFAEHKKLMAYMERLAARPSFARVLAEVAPHLAQFSKR